MHFAFAPGNHLSALKIQRHQALPDQPSLTPRSGGVLLLQNVVDLNGVTLGGFVRLSKHQRGNALAFELHERSSGDFCVVDGHKESVIEKRYCESTVMIKWTP